MVIQGFVEYGRWNGIAPSQALILLRIIASSLSSSAIRSFISRFVIASPFYISPLFARLFGAVLCGQSKPALPDTYAPRLLLPSQDCGVGGVEPPQDDNHPLSEPSALLCWHTKPTSGLNDRTRCAYSEACSVLLIVIKTCILIKYKVELV